MAQHSTRCCLISAAAPPPRRLPGRWCWGVGGTPCAAVVRPRRRATRASAVRGAAQWALDAITTGPAIVGNDRSDLLAANLLGRALYSDLYADPTRTPNFARYTFLDSAALQLFPDWALAADMSVANLRAAAGCRGAFRAVRGRSRRPAAV